MGWQSGVRTMMRWIGRMTALMFVATSVVACQAKSAVEPRAESRSSSSVGQTSVPATAEDHQPRAPKPAEPPDTGEKPDEVRAPKTPVKEEARGADSKSAPVFADNAFPPTIPDTEWHRNAWYELNCLRCHETGVGEAPMVMHQDMPAILLTAKCRSCHVLIPGDAPKEEEEGPSAEESPFAVNAFPPMMPNSESHKSAWTKDDCLLCHESGIYRAPALKHEDLPDILLKAKCRSCHVQIRAVEPGTPPR